MANAEIKTVLTADAKPLEGTLNKVQGQVSKMGAGGFIGMAKGLGAAGAAVAAVGFAARGIDSFIEKQGTMAERLNITSAGLGINTKELQAFMFTAKQAGNATDESLTSKLWKLQDSVEAVATGDKGMTDAFKRFGITAKEVVSLPLSDLLERIARGAQTSGTAVGDLNQVFGKGAAMELSGALQELATNGFGGLSDAAERAGQVIEDSTLKRLEAAKDRIEAFKQRVSNFFTELGGRVLGFFESPEQAGFREEARAQKATQQDRQRVERAAQLARVQAEAAKKEAEKEQKLQDRIAKMREKGQEVPGLGAIAASDALARVGALSGGRSGLIEALAKQQLEIQKRQADIEKQILEVLKNG